jgi:dGTPase
MDSDLATQRYAAQRALVRELVLALAERAPQHLDPPLAAAYEQADDDAGRLRVVLDHVASLTDTSAQSLHRRLTG